MNTQKLKIDGVEYQMMDFQAYYLKGFYDGQFDIVERSVPYLESANNNLTTIEKTSKETTVITRRLKNKVDRLSSRF